MSKLICPQSNQILIESCIKLGERIAGIRLYDYQKKFCREVIFDLLTEGANTLTALFSRQCVHPDTKIITPTGFKYAHELQTNDPVLSVFDNEICIDAIRAKTVQNLLFYKIKLFTNHEQEVSNMERFKKIDQTWGYIKDQSIKSGDQIQVAIDHILNEDISREDYSAKQAGLLMFGQQSRMDLSDILGSLGPTRRVQLKTKSRVYAESLATLLNTTASQSQDGYTVPIALEPLDREYVFSQRESILRHLFQYAEITTFQSNRGKKYKIIFKVGSSGVYRDALSALLLRVGIIHRFKKENIEIKMFDGIFLSLPFLKTHYLFSELRNYLRGYNSKLGVRLSLKDTFTMFKQFPILREFVKDSTYKYYKKNGIHLTKLLDLLFRTEIDPDTLFNFLPRTYYATIKDIYSTTVGDAISLETRVSGTYVAEGMVNHNSGKTEANSVICCSIMLMFPHLAHSFPDDNRFKKFKKGVWIGIFAPKAEQADDSYERIRTKFESDTGKEILNEFQVKSTVSKGDRVKLTNGSRCRACTAGKDSNIEGDTLHLIIGEESQDIDSKKFKKSIRPMRTATAGTILMIGTANMIRSYFWETITLNKRKTKEAQRQFHIQVDYQEASKVNPKYAISVVKEIEEMGIDSDEFKMSYMNLFLFERGMAFKPEQLEPFHPILNPEGLFYNYETTNFYNGYKTVIVGIDVGKQQDRTFCVAVEVDFENPIIGKHFIAYHKKLIGWTCMLGDNFPQQQGKVVDFLAQMNASKVLMDTTGKGDAFFDYLAEACEHIEFVPIPFSSKSKHMMYRSLIYDMNAGRVQFPCGKETKKQEPYHHFIREMGELEKSYTGAYLSCHKPTRSEHGVPHDDACFHPDTPMLIKRGGRVVCVNISEAVVGDLVITDKSRFKPVVATMKREFDGTLVEINIKKLGKCLVTANHPILTTTGYVPAGELKSGKHKAIKTFYKGEDKEELPDFDLLPVFENLARSSKKNNALIDMSKIISKGKKIKFNNPKAKFHNRFIKITPDLCRLIGYFISEGACGKHSVQFSFNTKETELHKDVTNLLAKCFGIAKKSIGVRHNANNSTAVYTSSRVIREFFKSLVPGTSSDRAIPTFILELALEFKEQVLRGIWLGDGYYNERQVSIVTTSPTLAYQMRDLFSELGAIFSIDVSKRAGRTCLIRDREVNHNYDLFQLRAMYFKDYNKSLALLSMVTNNLKKESAFHKVVAVAEETRVVAEIRSIKYLHKQENQFVYNLEVEDDHSYTVNNLTAHNCDALALACYGAKIEENTNQQYVEVRDNIFYTN